MTARKDEWETRYRKWKKKDKTKESAPKSLAEASVLSRTEKKNEIEKRVDKYYTEKTQVNKKRTRISKIIIAIIPLAMLFFLVYNNFLVSRDFNYLYDIGSEGDKYLTPIARVSEPAEDNGVSYRGLTEALVYFDAPVPLGSESLKIQVKFKDTLPDNWTMRLGARDQEVWHYNYHFIHNPVLNRLSELPKKDNIYLVNSELYFLTLDELKYESDIVVATDTQYAPLPNIVSDYKKEKTLITTSLRGAHIAYIYISGDLDLEVEKQDINWYEGSDELEISIYDLENNLIARTKIPDDGITEVRNKEKAIAQKGFLNASALKEGVYKIEFGNFDGVIREIRINTNKIVFERVFLADSALYNLETKPSLLYFKTNRNEQIELVTYHREGIQNISYLKDGKNNLFNFYQEDKPLYLELSRGEYEFKIPKNDIIISGMPYFSFSRESYFEPFKQKVVGIRNDFDWLINNVDYIVTEYNRPEYEGEWIIAETEFNINDEQLFVKDNKLNIVFNVPRLSQEGSQNYTVPIDWIKITVHKPGVFENEILI